MEKRLDDIALASRYDAGHQSLPWDPGQPSGLLAGVDLQSILESPNAREIVQELPVQILYYALKQKGLSESLDILPLMTSEQVTHMVDYEAWTGDTFNRQKLFRFMKNFAEISGQQLYERFADLDEEYQIASLQNLFKVYEVEHIYDLPHGVEDRAYAMPDNKVFYEILSEDKDEVAFLEQLMEAAKEHNLRYAYSLIGHAAYAIPNENEAQVGRFRKGRLEEDGFVSYEESQEIFAPIDRKALAKRWKHEGHSRDALMLQGSDLVFVDAVLMRARDQNIDIDAIFQVHQNLLYLANALCAASQVAVDDMHGVHRVLEQGKALVSLGLEYAADGSIDLGVKILLQEHPKTLFQAGYAIVEELRADVVKSLRRMNLPRSEYIERYFVRKQWGQIVMEIDRNWTQNIGLEAAEILKGLLNRFPMVAARSKQDDKRIEFHPVNSLGDFYELELEVQAILAFCASVVLSGRDMNRPFEVILREAATENLQKGMQPGGWQIDSSIDQLVVAWHDKLFRESELWMAGNVESEEEALDLAISMIYDSLHGLIVMPKSRSSVETPSEEMI